MSKINDLIKQYCPDGVEWKELKDVCKFQNGFAFKSEKFKNFGENAILRIQNIRNKSITLNNLVYFDDADYKNTNLKDFLVKKYDVVIAQSGATAGKIAINNTNNIFYLNQRIGKFIPNNNYLLNKFLYYFIDTKKEQILNMASGGGAQPNVSGNNILKLQVPIPPLPVQQEIVNILDKFTNLEAELEAELEGRKKQYEYYRNSLLTFGDDVEWKELGDVAEIYDGVHQTPKYKDNGIKFVSVENIQNLYATNKYISIDDYNKYKVKPQINDLFMTRIGSIGVCSIVDKNEDLAYYVTLSLIRPSQNHINTKFLKYLIESQIGKNELYKRTLINAVPIKINVGDIGKIKLPIPPLPVQEKIVAILDKFDKLVNDIKEGLPAEIALRRKQYEFYRNKLLDFKDMEK